MARSEYGKERIALFTRYFIEDNRPITVYQLMEMFEKYSGVKTYRQTVYSDLNAISVVIPLGRVRDRRTNAWIWFRKEVKQ